MKRFVLVLLAVALYGCAEPKWTERFSTGGFRRVHVTKVRYHTGGLTTFRVNISSEESKKLQYPITLKVLLDGTLCSEAAIQTKSTEPCPSMECSSFLGPGMHVYKVLVSNPNNFANLTDEEDILFNSVDGSITYIFEERF